MQHYVSPSVTELPSTSFNSRPSATSEFASGFMKGFGFGSPHLSLEVSSSLEAYIG